MGYKIGHEKFILCIIIFGDSELITYLNYKNRFYNRNFDIPWNDGILILSQNNLIEENFL